MECTLWSYTTFTFLLISLSHSGNVKPRTEKYLPDYSIYHNLSHIQTHLIKLAQDYPAYMKLDTTSFTSKEGRSQPLLHLTNFSNNRVKHNVLFSYGEHAREFFPVESMFHLIEQVMHGLNSPMNNEAREFSRLVLSKFNVFIIGMLNPDGRKYVETSKNYCWRGTSTGVDLNRNFGWQFGGKGSSSNKKDEEYRGEAPFSERETEILTELSRRTHYDAFISFHSGIKQIYLPFSDTDSKQTKRLPVNIESMKALAKEMVKATSDRFTYGVAWQLNDYTADGTIFDYMAGIRQTPFSYAIELWGIGDHGGAQCFDLFNPRSQDLKVALSESFPIYETFFYFLDAWKDKQSHRSSHLPSPDVEAPSLSFGIILLCCIIIVFILFIIHGKLPHSYRVFPVRKVISLKALSSSYSLMKLTRRE